MNRHLKDISEQVAPGSHAVLVLDGAGWHKSKELEFPKNISLLFLPPYSPELNSMGNVFEFVKSNKLANRFFETVEDVTPAVERSMARLRRGPETHRFPHIPKVGRLEPRRKLNIGGLNVALVSA